MTRHKQINYSKHGGPWRRNYVEGVVRALWLKKNYSGFPHLKLSRISTLRRFRTNSQKSAATREQAKQSSNNLSWWRPEWYWHAATAIWDSNERCTENFSFIYYNRDYVSFARRCTCKEIKSSFFKTRRYRWIQTTKEVIHIGTRSCWSHKQTFATWIIFCSKTTWCCSRKTFSAIAPRKLFNAEAKGCWIADNPVWRSWKGRKSFRIGTLICHWWKKKYTKQCCTFCHERGHNRSKCPNKNRPCKSAKYCGEIARHPDERDKLRELKAIREKLGKELEKETKEYGFRQGLTEKTMEDKIRDKLLLDVPERYTRYSDSGSSINHLQLNSDVIGFQSYCEKRRIKTPMSLINTREVLQQISSESLTAYAGFSGFVSHTPGTAPTSVEQIHHLWQLKGVKIPKTTADFRNSSFSPGTATIAKSDPCQRSQSEKTTCGWYGLKPSSLEEEQEQLWLAILDSTHLANAPTYSIKW